MTTSRIKDNSMKGILLFCLFSVLSIKSCTVLAQSSRGPLDDLIKKKVNTWGDSIRKLQPRKYPIYFGGEISLVAPQYTLKSKIAALDGLSVSYLGTNLGVVVGNPLGKLKADAGLYYSNASVPYDMDMYQGGISASIYLLRLNEIKFHSFEPYVSLGFVHQQTQFYGNYLSNDQGKNVPTNYSSSDSPLLGHVGSNQMNLNVGIEYQLESPHNFIHLFAEVGYGALISSNASNSSFSKTKASNPSSISIGINFGILK